MYPIDWEKIFTNIFAGFNALGSLATVGAFIYLFKKDKEKQAQIDKLTAIAGELTQMKAIDSERLNLSVKPILKFKFMTNGSDGTLEIRIINEGERAVLTKFDLISEDLEIYNEGLPYTLEPSREKKIYTRTKKETHITECEYQINIHYTDKIKNRYITELKGKGIENSVIKSYIQEKATFN